MGLPSSRHLLLQSLGAIPVSGLSSQPHQVHQGSGFTSLSGTAV